MTFCVVCGASGFIGKALVDRLAESGFAGQAVSRRRMTNLPLQWTWQPRDVVLRTPVSLSGVSCISPTASGDRDVVLVHLEVKHHAVDPRKAEIAEFQAVNVEGVRHWLNWCDTAEVLRIVYFSTVKAISASSHCQDELADGDPSTLYGQSKREAERLVSDWASRCSKRAALILRPAVVYGPGNQGNMFLLVECLARRRFFLIGRGENVKSLVSLRNLCAATVFLMQRMQPGLEVFNIVDRQTFSFRDISQMIARLMGVRWSERSLPLGLVRGLAWGGDLISRLAGSFPLTTSRLEALTESAHFSCAKLLAKGFCHPQTTEDGLRELIEWYKNRDQASTSAAFAVQSISAKS
ncbi:MAG: NAD(P)-dependent oxidoreductase [Verrucomicrobiales bacterium]|nr:NAD(P)-dependent oxidoreductase [Verrucomicrobiales bacterium]